MQKINFILHLFTLILFKTCMTFYILQNAKDILKNIDDSVLFLGHLSHAI